MSIALSQGSVVSGLESSVWSPFAMFLAVTSNPFPFIGIIHIGYHFWAVSVSAREAGDDCSEVAYCSVLGGVDLSDHTSRTPVQG